VETAQHRRVDRSSTVSPTHIPVQVESIQAEIDGIEAPIAAIKRSREPRDNLTPGMFRRHTVIDSDHEVLARGVQRGQVRWLNFTAKLMTWIEIRELGRLRALQPQGNLVDSRETERHVPSLVQNSSTGNIQRNLGGAVKSTNLDHILFSNVSWHFLC